MPLAAPDVVRLFTAGSSYDCGQGMTATVTVLPETALALPSGKVAACDPFIGLGDDLDPFTAEVDPGTYPVVLSVVEITRGEVREVVDERVAAAWLQVSDKPTVEWTLALSDGQALDDLGDTEFFGYGVDAGTGCFVDATASAPLGDLLAEDYELLEAALFGEENSMVRAPAVLTDPESGHSLIAFSSGWGDGHYPTWVGRSIDGTITGFVTEFFVVPQPGRDPVDE
ncbi:DUF4241 domain-containing protein [Kitasatospora sp. RB6PN24]|uniref:DUF4241 domain-containing protein n=1 Tax=Kitasatospora humi TaxID=2893891 RepID=UPI001E5BC474|nr:DUF4241 domain-containing protein [Kitasatospora humi]MCC9311928.1 DUF4241 domain-containing protein [Kitasatospora humi]